MVAVLEAVIQKCRSCDYEFSADEAKTCPKCNSSICPKCGECLCEKVKNAYSPLRYGFA